MKYIITIALAISSLLSGPIIAQSLTSEDSVATLIRNNHTNVSIRVHLATFDSANGFQFNWHYCQKTADFLESDAKTRGSIERIWCEKGYFKE